MWWTKPLCNSAEDLGTLAENEPPTGYEPNDHFITEAYVEYTQESTGEQRSPMTSTTMTSPSARRSWTRAEDEPITLKKKACRPVCRRQSVSHDRTLFAHLIHKFQVTKKHRDNSESEQIRILLERQREQILADCQAEIRKHEFQADHDRRSIQKLNETIESQKEEICRAHQGHENLRQYHQLLHEQLLKQNWDLREAHEKKGRGLR